MRRGDAHRTRLGGSDADVCTKNAARERIVRFDRSKLFAYLRVPLARDDKGGVRRTHDEIGRRERRECATGVTHDDDDGIRKVIILL